MKSFAYRAEIIEACGISCGNVTECPKSHVKLYSDISIIFFSTFIHNTKKTILFHIRRYTAEDNSIKVIRKFFFKA